MFVVNDGSQSTGQDHEVLLVSNSQYEKGEARGSTQGKVVVSRTKELRTFQKQSRDKWRPSRHFHIVLVRIDE